MKKGKGELIGYNMDVKFGGFYSPNPDYKNDLEYIIIGIHDGWYYPTKEEMKLYYDYMNSFQTNYVLGKNK